MKILAFDDQQKNLEFLERAALAFQDNCELETKLVETEETWQKAADALNQQAGDFAVLLDLGYRPMGMESWSAVKRALLNLSPKQMECKFTADGELKFTHEASTLVIPNQAIDGLALLLTLLGSNVRGRTALFTMTAAGNHPAIQLFIETAIRQYAEGAPPREVDLIRNAPVPVSDNRAKGILSDVVDQWRMKYESRFHPDTVVDTAVKRWLSFYNELKIKRQEGQFCQHGVSLNGSIEQSAKDYARLVREMFEISILDEDLEGLKAILMMRVFPAADKDSFPAFYPWAAGADQPEKRIISANTLTPILRRVFGCEVRVMALEIDFLPTLPALPFLLSLRVLIDAMKHQERQDGGIFDEQAGVVLRGQFSDASSGEIGPPYRLEIPLKVKSGKEFALARTWREKCESGMIKAGVCGALWNASCARVDITMNGCRSDEMVILKLFEGEDKPVTAVGFTPHKIVLSWG